MPQRRLIDIKAYLNDIQRNPCFICELVAGNPEYRHQLIYWVFDQFEFPSKGHILELGCGPGLLWQRNAPRIPAGWKIILSDLSPGMLREAQSKLYPMIFLMVLLLKFLVARNKAP